MLKGDPNSQRTWNKARSSNREEPALAQWKGRDIPNVEIHLSEPLTGSEPVPIKYVQTVQAAETQRRVRRKEKHGSFPLASEPLSGMRRWEEGVDTAVGLGGLFTLVLRKARPAVLSPSYQKDHSLLGYFSRGVLCPHKAAASWVLSGN